MPLDKADVVGLFNAWDRLSREITILFHRKHISYGADNISATGLQGITIRMWDKINRLRRLALFDIKNSLDNETLEDTLMDLAAYAMIGLLVYRDIWPEFEE